MNGLHAERIWVSIRRLVGSIRGRLRESVDQLVANRFTADCCSVPAETFVEIPLLEPLTDVVDDEAVVAGLARVLATLEPDITTESPVDLGETRGLLLDIAGAFDAYSLSEIDLSELGNQFGTPHRSNAALEAIGALTRLTEWSGGESPSGELGSRPYGSEAEFSQSAGVDPVGEFTVSRVFDQVGAYGTFALTSHLLQSPRGANDHLRLVIDHAKTLLETNREGNAVGLFMAFVSGYPNDRLLLDRKYDAIGLRTILEGYKTLLRHEPRLDLTSFSTTCRDVLYLYIKTDDDVDNPQSAIRMLYRLTDQERPNLWRREKEPVDIARELNSLVSDLWREEARWEKIVDLWRWRIYRPDGSRNPDTFLELGEFASAVFTLQTVEYERGYLTTVERRRLE